MKTTVFAVVCLLGSNLLLAAADPFADSLRTWRDVNGREIQAVFKGLAGDKVKLEKDGQVYIFPLSQLSAADQSHARNLQASPAKSAPVPVDPRLPPPLSDLELQVAPDVNVALVEQLVLKHINEIRKARNINVLSNNDEIARVARTHSMDMATRGFFSHNNPDGEDPTARARKAGFTGLVSSPDGQPRLGLSENIGRVGRYASFQRILRDGKMIRRRIRWQTEATMAEQLVEGWMASPPHRANILDSAKAYLGVGIHVHREHVFATQNFF